ncbi:MAG: glycosyltransferase family 2 protein [Bacteroidota bacterium]
MKPLISIISVNYNELEVTCEMIESIRNNSYSNVEIIVVDNASRKNPEAYLKKHYPEVKFIRSEKNLGFAGGNNLGIQESTGDFLFFLNNDAELTSGALETLLEVFVKFPRAGVASPKICYYIARPSSGPDVIQYVGATHVNSFTARNSILGEGEDDNGQYRQLKRTAYAHGAAMMVPRKVISKIGMLPEDFFLYYEELDWCEQMKRAGFEVFVEPNAKVYHKESYSVNKVSALKTYYLNRNRILFMQRNRSGLQLAAFGVFLLFFTIPKNTLLFVLKNDWVNLKAFYQAILWHLQKPKKLRPASTPRILKFPVSEFK